MERRARRRSRLHHPGARLRRRTGAAGQERRPRHRPGRPRHQGRPDRRTARGRAHGRRRPQFRRRARLSLPHPARGQEPFRSHRRDRRVRDGRRRPARSAQPLGPVPRRRQGPGARRRRLCRDRGITPRSGGNTGSCRAFCIRHAKASGRRLGLGSSRHAAGGSGGSLRSGVRRQGRISERRGRNADQRARRRPGRRRRPDLLGAGHAPAPGLRRLRRDRPVRRGPRRRPRRGPPARGQEAGLRARPRAATS